LTKKLPNGEAARQLPKQINFGGVCLKKSEFTLRRTLKTKMDSAEVRSDAGSFYRPV
jgi:hypothetical protein